MQLTYRLKKIVLTVVQYIGFAILLVLFVLGRLSLPFLMILRQKSNSNYLTHLPRPIVATGQT